MFVSCDNVHGAGIMHTSSARAGVALWGVDRYGDVLDVLNIPGSFGVAENAQMLPFRPLVASRDLTLLEFVSTPTKKRHLLCDDVN